MDYRLTWFISFIGFIALTSLLFSTIFYTLLPGVLMTLPKSGSKNIICATHTGMFMGIFVLLFIINDYKNRSYIKFTPFMILLVLYMSVLFYALLPGVLMTLPNDGSEKIVNVVHTGIFGISTAVSFIVLFVISSGK